MVLVFWMAVWVSLASPQILSILPPSSFLMVMLPPVKVPPEMVPMCPCTAGPGLFQPFTSMEEKVPLFSKVPPVIFSMVPAL